MLCLECMLKPALIILSCIFLTGCYQSSLTSMVNIAGPAAGASQGNAVTSAVSTGLSYGVKHKTGKYPIEHVLKREKDKVLQKVALIENEFKKTSSNLKNVALKSKDNLLEKKDSLNVKDKVKNLRWVSHVKEIKNVAQEEAFPANKPRYSYWSKLK